MYDETIYPFPNFNGATVEVWEWICNSIPHFTEHVLTYPYWDMRLSTLQKGAQGVKTMALWMGMHYEWMFNQVSIMMYKRPALCYIECPLCCCHVTLDGPHRIYSTLQEWACHDVTLAAVTGKAIIASCIKMKSSQLTWKLGIRRFHPQCPIFQWVAETWLHGRIQ